MEKIVITIPNYIREIQTAESQRTLYWEYDGSLVKCKNRLLLKKYLKDKTKPATADNIKSDYTLTFFLNNKILTKNLSDINPKDKIKTRLTFNNEPIIANESKAGKPRIVKIKGQDIYSGKNEFTRAKVMESIKESFKEHLKDLKPVSKYPIKITMELHDTIYDQLDKNDHRWDIDNRCYPYAKAFPDVLTELKIIRDDDMLSITQPPAIIFCPITPDKERKLVFIIEYDDRKIIHDFSEFSTPPKQTIIKPISQIKKK